MRYTTPRDDVTSPLYVASSEVSAQQPRWTPAPSSNAQRPHQLKLIWNGFTRADFEAMFQEAQQLERLARIEDAEVKFREALSGFENLLSATHKVTTAVAYRLASFYAQNDRMKDADAVLDWVTGNHIERFGNRAVETVEHLLYVVEIFSNWSRNEDAMAFLSRIMDVLVEEVKNTQDKAKPVRNTNSGNVDRTRPMPHQPRSSDDPMRTIDGSEPVTIDLQLGVATGYINANHKAAEPLLLRLIEQCENHPKDLAVQILRCRSTLLRLYYNEDRDKMNEALDQSRKAFWEVLNSKQEKTQSLSEAAAEVAKWYVKAGRYQTADDMFIQIQSDAVDTFGADNRRTISLFRSIGFFYQNEGRWDDAQPWFEQALVACYKAEGKESICVKRLEAALEKQHYDMSSPPPDEGN
jgi:tetratricopeptide (TPR) repeat protein